ncbi:hypothetical protein [Pseudoxanthomonas putridarboris]|uniref:Uncharacterized protein n=1 Tax=Pseudoxanthomonas putridarboris TaxID=752605 RepID=A0ABU9IVJ4_9GAMM
MERIGMAQGRQAQVIASGVVVVVHLALLWTLWESGRRTASHAESAPLRVRWVARPRAVEAPGLPPDPARIDPASAGTVAPTHPRTAAPSPAAPSAPTPSPTAADLPPRPDYLAQGTEWARQTAPPPDFQPDLLASRGPSLPGGSGQERIRMKDPVTPANVVGFIGRLFGDPGDPCPRKRRNVDDSLTDTSPEGRRRLEWELREYREHCRP